MSFERFILLAMLVCISAATSGYSAEKDLDKIVRRAISTSSPVYATFHDIGSLGVRRTVFPPPELLGACKTNRLMVYDTLIDIIEKGSPRDAHLAYFFGVAFTNPNGAWIYAGDLHMFEGEQGLERRASAVRRLWFDRQHPDLPQKLPEELDFKGPRDWIPPYGN